MRAGPNLELLAKFQGFLAILLQALSKGRLQPIHPQICEERYFIAKRCCVP